jgi:hypothetical protein
LAIRAFILTQVTPLSVFCCWYGEAIGLAGEVFDSTKVLIQFGKRRIKFNHCRPEISGSFKLILTRVKN